MLLLARRVIQVAVRHQAEDQVQDVGQHQGHADGQAQLVFEVGCHAGPVQLGRALEREQRRPDEDLKRDE